MTPFISFEDVHFSYNGSTDDSVRAVNGVTLDIPEGKITVILGRNGSGKSTMAKLMNGLLIPQSGRVLVDGIDTADEERIWDVRSRVGMVFQNPDNQIVGTTVEEDVAFGPENLGVPYDELHSRVAEALDQVGMTEYAGSAPNKLSGGQKQRISIAGVLAMKTRCLVMDESTAMLDPRGRRDILDLILSFNREQGITVILITHFMDEAALADNVVVTSGGKVLISGTPREVFSHPDIIAEAGLEQPPINRILSGLRQHFPDLDDTALTMYDAVQEIADQINETN